MDIALLEIYDDYDHNLYSIKDCMSVIVKFGWTMNNTLETSFHMLIVLLVAPLI